MNYKESTLKDLQILKKEYKVQANHYRDLMWEAQAEFEAITIELKERKQAKCEHSIIDKRSNSIFEPGKMSHPHYYDEYFCKKCQKIVNKELYKKRKEEIIDRHIAKEGGNWII